MNALPLIAAGLLGCAVLAGYALMLVGMHHEARWHRFDETPHGWTAAFARWITGCHVHRGPASTRPMPPRPGRRVRTARGVRHG